MTSTREEFLRFVRPQWSSMHRVARRYTVSVEDAHDLVQETMLRAWRNFSPDQERVYRRAWLFTIMRSAVIDWQRTAQRRIRLVVATDPELTELAPADLTESFQSLPSMDEEQFREFLDDRVAAALQALDPRFREVILLSVAGDLNYREIAEVLDCPMGTVMSRMARARRALREHLAAFATEMRWVREEQP